MTIIVHDMDKDYVARMEHGDSHVDFHFRQLTYQEKSEIVHSTTTHNQGTVTQDMNMSDFLSIKIALKSVKGLYKRVVKDELDSDIRFEKGVNEDLFEEVEYKLEFDKDGRVTDSCINEIFNTPFEDRLAYTAKHIIEGVPNVVTHPYTKQEIEGVTIVQPKGGMQKK